MNIIKYNKAFTLAEVLITLMTIGILATITIPSILQTWEEKEIVSKLKETYSILNQAYQLAVLENGDAFSWPATSHDIIYNNIKVFLKLKEDCGRTVGGCTNPDGIIKSLNELTNYSDPRGYPKVTLVNGATVYFLRYSDYYNLIVDINGAKKPNIFGKDVFLFDIRKAGFFPRGGDFDGTNLDLSHNRHCKNKNNYGYTCARWVIERGNMNYLHKDTSW